MAHSLSVGSITVGKAVAEAGGAGYTVCLRKQMSTHVSAFLPIWSLILAAFLLS